MLAGVSLGVLMHWWPHFGELWRSRLSIAMSVAGLAFLLAAVRAEGVRESAMTSVVLVGPAYHVATTSAQASEYYYVLTAVCLLLGFTALAAGDRLAGWLSARPLVGAVAVAWLVTLVRVLLEKSAAPAVLAQAVGVTWMAPVAGAYLAWARPAGERGWRPLARRLTAYAFLVRGLIALLGLVATRLHLGTHYDVSRLGVVHFAFAVDAHAFAPGSWPQLLWLTFLPQLAAWPLFTVGVGLIGAAALSSLRPPRETSRDPLPVAAAGSRAERGPAR